MKKGLQLLVFMLFTSILTHAQLTGTKTIPGDYPSLAAAISALNTSGVGTGGVTFNVAAGYTETFPTPLAGLISVPTSSPANPIIIKKSGSGANPLITAGTGTGTADFIICISGTNSVTFDGINLQENPVNTTTVQQMEWGYAILKASADQGSQNTIIRNCSVSLDKTNTASTGIYMDNVTQAAPAVQLVITNLSGTNSNNKFYNNTISNVYRGIYLSGYADPNSPYAFYDQNNDIGSVAGNSITDFGGGSATVYGVYASSQNVLTIANSTVNGGTGSTSAVYGIYGGTANNAGLNIYGNNVTVSSSGSTAGLFGIYNAGLGNGGTSNTLNFYNNSISNCTYPTAGAVTFYGLYNVATAGFINIYNNTLQNNVIGGSCSLYLIYSNSTATNTMDIHNNIISNNQCSGTGTQTDVSYIFGIQSIGWGNVSIHDNQVFNNSIPNQTKYGGVIYGIHGGFSAQNLSINNNSIHDLSVSSSATQNTTHNVHGIYASVNSFSNAASNTIQGNNIYNLIVTLSSAYGGNSYGIYSGYIGNISSNTISNILFTNSSGGYGYGAGIYYNSGGTGQVFRNSISNVTMAGTSAYYNGIIINAGDNVSVYNNYIYDLRAPNSTSATSLSGINIANGIRVSLFYNTIYLNASSTSSGNFGTSGVYASTTPVLEMRNNLIVNTCTAPSSTTYKTVSFRRSSTAFNTYSTVSNNNDFFAGTPSATNLVFYDGTNSIQTLQEFKSFAVQRDANSITEMPPFMNFTVQPYDLHLKSSVPNQCESGGSVVSGALNITSDYDGNPRYPNPGYPYQAGFPPNAPDMGADEFGGIPLDLTPPSIIFTPLSKTSSTTARTLTATITDISGVPTSGIGLPVLYWKKFTAGSWNLATAVWVSANTYTFTFGGGVTLNDSVYYYVAAQDLVSPAPNVGATPLNGSGYTANPPSCSVPPPNASLYSYKIVGTLCGSYNIGTGQVYPTITSAVNDLNNMEVTCPVIFQLMDAAYPSETFPLIISNPAGVSANNTVTFRPAPGVSPLITGSASCLFKFNSASNITIDGSNSGGTDRSLTISNTIASGTTAVIWIGSNGAGQGSCNNIIKNCNISSAYVTSTSYAIFIGSSVAIGTSGDDNDNITLQNNVISKAYRGIYSQASTVGVNDNLKIINNVIGSDLSSSYITNYGIYLAGVNAPQVSGNVIYNMINNIAATICGIELNSNVSNALIANNSIHDLKSNYSYGPAVYGINIGTGFSVTNATLINNLIYNITSVQYAAASTQYNPFGVRIVSGSGHKLYHNTINMTGSQTPPGTSASLSAALVFPYPIVTGLDIRNNIFANNIIGLPNSSSYCVYAVAGATFGTIDNNDYYPSGAYGILGFLGSQQTTLAGWKNATGQDANSVNVDPAFTSATNLIPTTTAMPHAGTYLTAVPTDFTGVNRTNPPDIGAYEFTPSPLITTSSATSVLNNSAILNGIANASGTTFNLTFDFGTTTAYGTNYAATPASASGSIAVSMSKALSGLTPLTTYHFRAKGVTSTGLTVYGNDMSFTTLPDLPLVVTSPATSVTSSGAVLNGSVNPNGVTANSTFEWGLTAAYGNTVNSVPNIVSGSGATPVTAALTGLLPNTTYHYRCTGTNVTGTAYGADLTFTTPAILPLVITDAATAVGTSGATLNGSVTANNSATTVSFQWGTTTAYGNTVSASPVTVNGMTSTAVQANLSSLAWSTLYHFRCVGVNSAGTVYGADMTFNTGCPVPSAPGTISGPQSVCQNQNSVNYTISPIPNATNYNWTVPAGASIVSGAGTTSINVDFSPSAVSGNITVTGTNFCMTGPAGNLAITVNPMPVPLISGPAASCVLSAGNVYTTDAGMSNYSWTVSAGGTITAGSGTNSVTVTWNNTGAQSVSVNYANANGCSALAPSAYNVTVNGLPSPTITGPASMCAGSGYNTYTTESGMSNYNWSVSAGGTIVSGAGSNSIQVAWNNPGAQTVSVNYTNANGCQAVNPSSYAVTVNGVPAAAGAISGPSSVCVGTQGVAYSVAPISGALAYVWTLPQGASAVSGANTNSIVVDFAANAVSGTISVAGNNLCGNGPSASLDVSVNPIPPAPLVSVSGYVLTSSSPTGNQWYHEGTAVTGATSQTYTVPANAPGWYWTIVTLNGCTSDSSNHVYIAGVGIGEHFIGSVNIYPVPNNGSFSVAIRSEKETTFTMEIFNTIGVKVYGNKITTVNREAIIPVEMGTVPGGLYTIVLRSNDNRVIRKILITN